MPSEVDVAIVGCGPVGAVAANLLGDAGHSLAVFDQAREFHNETRAIHMDHEAMRILQSIDVDRRIAPHVRPFRGMEFVDADHQRLFLLNAADENSGEQGYMFNQPALELALRDRIDENAHTELHLGTEVTGLRQDHSCVRVQVTDTHTGSRREISARYVIAADGAASPVRKQLGVELDNISFDEPWVVVDCELRHEVETPQFGQQVCDVRRPSTFIPGEGAHRRWEFMLLPGEDPAVVNSQDKLYELMAPWGMTPGNVRIKRSAVYVFHALVAQQWRRGPVFLAGDACHQTPPFLGQGMCAGFRDVANLAWKLDFVLRELADSRLLDTYEEERKPHARRLVEEAVTQGHIICTTDPAMAAKRDEVISDLASVSDLSFYDAVPSLDRGLLHSPTADGPAGMLAPHPRVSVTAGEVHFLDKVAGSGFRLVSRETAPLDDLRPDLRRFWDAIGGRCLSTSAAASGNEVIAVGDVDGRLAGFFATHRCSSFLVRPDHYVYGCAVDGAGAEALVADLMARLSGSAETIAPASGRMA